MRKRFLLFGITLAAMVTSCYGPDDSLDYYEELDVVYTGKADGYDFDNGSWTKDTKKTHFHLAKTVTVIDSKGDELEIPDENIKNRSEILSDDDALALIEKVHSNMIGLDWLESTTLNPTEQELKELVLTKVILSKTTYVGGGYYPGYPGWGWGYPGYGGWYPYYYSYSTGSVIVEMAESNVSNPSDIKHLDLIWSSLLSGYTRNGIKIEYLKKAIDQGFDQSTEYLQR